MYAPTTLVPARDFWTLRYTTTLEDGSLVVRIVMNLISLLNLWRWFITQGNYWSLCIHSCFFQVCERSLSGSGGGQSNATAQQFVRAEMLPSGYLVRQCEGGGSIVRIVDHLDLDVWSRNSTCLLVATMILNALRLVSYPVQSYLTGLECSWSSSPPLWVV